MPDLRTQLERLGLPLPEPPAPLANYAPAAAISSGRIVLISGQLPMENGSLIAQGSVPADVDIDTAVRCARQCVLNALAVLERELGDLALVRRVVRLEGFVACGSGFADHPAVIDGASALLVELLGEHGRHARTAVGAPSLPRNAPVEIAFTFLVD